MHPTICTIGPFTVYSYGLMLALAFMAGQHLALAQAKKQGLAPEVIFNFLFFSVIYGVLGARIFYVAGNLKDYLSNPLEIIMLQHGGLSWFGGLILGALGGIAYLKRKRAPVYRVLDVVAPFLALGQAIGRIGCFLNGCCYGLPAKFGVYIPGFEAALIPTQLYSSLLLLVIYFILRRRQDKSHFAGEIFFLYLFLYSLKRFFIEFWRADNPVVLWGLTLFQVLSIFLCVLALVKLKPRLRGMPRK